MYYMLTNNCPSKLQLKMFNFRVPFSFDTHWLSFHDIVKLWYYNNLVLKEKFHNCDFFLILEKEEDIFKFLQSYFVLDHKYLSFLWDKLCSLAILHKPLSEEKKQIYILFMELPFYAMFYIHWNNCFFHFQENWKQ